MSFCTQEQPGDLCLMFSGSSMTRQQLRIWQTCVSFWLGLVTYPLSSVRCFALWDSCLASCAEAVTRVTGVVAGVYSITVQCHFHAEDQEGLPCVF